MDNEYCCAKCGVVGLSKLDLFDHICNKEEKNLWVICRDSKDGFRIMELDSFTPCDATVSWFRFARKDNKEYWDELRNRFDVNEIDDLLIAVKDRYKYQDYYCVKLTVSNEQRID